MSFCIDGLSCALSDHGIDLIRWFPNGRYYTTNAKEAEYAPLECPCIGFIVDHDQCTDRYTLYKVINDITTKYMNRHDLDIIPINLKESKAYLVAIGYKGFVELPLFNVGDFNMFKIGSKRRLISLIKEYLPKLERKPLRNPDGGKKWIEWHLRKL